MRVLLLHDYGTPTGGAERQALALRDGLRAAGHEVELLASRASLVPGEQLADRTCAGTTVGRLQIVSQTANPSAVRQLRAELRRFRPDVVHVRMFLAQLSPLVLPLLREVPTVWQAVWYKAICPRGTKLLPDQTPCHEPSGRACLRHRCVTPQSWVLHMAQEAMVHRWRGAFDAVTTLSEPARARLEAAGFTDVEVVPNGVPVRPPRPPLTGPPVVAFAGRLVPEKGVGVLLRALPEVARAVPDVRAVVAGHGPERAELEALAAELGVADRVRFTGHLDRDGLEACFDDAWVQVVPGLWEEPFGNVATEAMMRGTAVVASRLGGPASIVRDGRTGVLVAPGRVDELAAALVPLLADRDHAEALGAAGRAVALDEYGADRVVARFEALYRRVVAASAAADVGPA